MFLKKGLLYLVLLQIKIPLILFLMLCFITVARQKIIVALEFVEDLF